MFFPDRAGPWLARMMICCLLTGVTGNAAQADDLLAWREADTMTELVGTLETWLDRNADLPRRDTAPVIRRIDRAAALAMSTARHTGQGAAPRGRYDPDTATVWLVRPWSPRDPFDVSVLLHELVHHRQAEAGHWYCPGAQELPAYKLQRAWLAELGLEPEVNWIAVVLEAGCTPRDIHPD